MKRITKTLMMMNYFELEEGDKKKEKEREILE